MGRFCKTATSLGFGTAQERIFERFARGASASSTGTGTGLGLAIVKEIAALHSATVHLTRSVSGGASFSILFPPWR